ncbi:hypothetical protein BURMUCGD2M_0203 [Burkholderia multivorans CGD2M]|uniref:Uncharacterized protein n=1 Tax=Burkholderia multivorans CGD2 TaxID=513052 RepID=B9C089_9BURK|nr:hypothetical protein BURMUCGD2_0203 [Burkholderia multivorans CGD2]EEE10155.1 hypothetical protein BURMUCGD2M_0203 [Burkholderia multivorans CGD2M]
MELRVHRGFLNGDRTAGCAMQQHFTRVFGSGLGKTRIFCRG